jgi:hypothetical protein
MPKQNCCQPGDRVPSDDRVSKGSTRVALHRFRKGIPGNVSFTFTVGDPTASFSCQLDSESWTACTSPKSYTGVGLGSHTFRVKATNAEGTEPTPATYTW